MSVNIFFYLLIKIQHLDMDMDNILKIILDMDNILKIILFLQLHILFLNIRILIAINIR